MNCQLLWLCCFLSFFHFLIISYPILLACSNNLSLTYNPAYSDKSSSYISLSLSSVQKFFPHVLYLSFINKSCWPMSALDHQTLRNISYFRSMRSVYSHNEYANRLATAILRWQKHFYQCNATIFSPTSQTESAHRDITLLCMFKKQRSHSVIYDAEAF